MNSSTESQRCPVYYKMLVVDGGITLRAHGISMISLIFCGLFIICMISLCLWFSFEIFVTFVVLSQSAQDFPSDLAPTRSPCS